MLRSLRSVLARAFSIPAIDRPGWAYPVSKRKGMSGILPVSGHYLHYKVRWTHSALEIVDYRYSCFDFADYLYLQAGLDRSIHIPGYHALDSVGTERKIQTLAKSMFRKDIIGGGLAGSIHGSAYLKLSALQSGFNG